MKILNKHQLFMNQAPCWNFELDEDQLLDKALEVGFVTKVDEDLYEVNDNYKSSGGWTDRFHSRSG
jgi:hypothetical protein